MVRMCHAQKAEQTLKTPGLSHWRDWVRGDLGQKHRDLPDDWMACAVGGEEMIRPDGPDLKDLKDLSPDAIKLGRDFSVALQWRDNQKTINPLAKIGHLPPIWRGG